MTNNKNVIPCCESGIHPSQIRRPAPAERQVLIALIGTIGIFGLIYICYSLGSRAWNNASLPDGIGCLATASITVVLALKLYAWLSEEWKTNSYSYVYWMDPEAKRHLHTWESCQYWMGSEHIWKHPIYAGTPLLLVTTTADFTDIEVTAVTMGQTSQNKVVDPPSDCLCTVNAVKNGYQVTWAGMHKTCNKLSGAWDIVNDLWRVPADDAFQVRRMAEALERARLRSEGLEAMVQDLEKMVEVERDQLLQAIESLVYLVTITATAPRRGPTVDHIREAGVREIHILIDQNPQLQPLEKLEPWFKHAAKELEVTGKPYDVLYEELVVKAKLPLDEEEGEGTQVQTTA